jgi:ParB/RepB/Spo0J family partition protein
VNEPGVSLAPVSPRFPKEVTFVTGPSVIYVTFDLIDDDPRNPRGEIDLVDVAALKESLEQDGIQDPIQLIAKGDGRYWLHEGHRRKLAAIEAGHQGAPALIRCFKTDLDRVVSQRVMHTHAIDWDPMAWARYLHRLYDEFNLTRWQIARRLAKSPNWVRDTVSFIYLKPGEQRELATGEMTRKEALRRLKNRRDLKTGRTPTSPPPVSGTPVIPKQRKPTGEPNLNGEHRLAEQVAARCASGGIPHAARPKIGGVGCGFCWEQVIADDAIATATLPALVKVA